MKKHEHNFQYGGLEVNPILHTTWYCECGAHKRVELGPDLTSPPLKSKIDKKWQDNNEMVRIAIASAFRG